MSFMIGQTLSYLSMYLSSFRECWWKLDFFLSAGKRTSEESTTLQGYSERIYLFWKKVCSLWKYLFYFYITDSNVVHLSEYFISDLLKAATRVDYLQQSRECSLISHKMLSILYLIFDHCEMKNTFENILNNFYSFFSINCNISF